MIALPGKNSNHHQLITTKPHPLTLADIFRPMPGGRSIRAAKVPGVGTHVTYVDGVFGDGWFIEHARRWANFDRFEIDRDGICVLVAASRWRRFSDRPLWVCAWREKATGKSWVLQSDCEPTWRAVLFDVGYRFRAMTKPENLDEERNSLMLDNFALSLLG